MARKIYKSVVGAPDDAGRFSAVFAQIGPPPDHQGDISVAGCFGGSVGQAVTIEPWDHSSGAPTGKGRVFERGTQAVVEGQFFLGSSAGRDTYEAVRELGPQAQWSYTFTIEDAEPGKWQNQRVQFLKALDVWSVGPVRRAAGIGTHTEWVKGAGRRTWLPIGLPLTPAGVKGEVARLRASIMDPSELMLELLGMELDALAFQAKELGAETGPSRLDRIIERLRREYPEASVVWIQTMAEIIVAEMADRIYLEQSQGLVSGDRVQAHAQAWAWARSTA